MANRKEPLEQHPEGGSAPRVAEWQISQIVESLRAGKPLPPHLFPQLFEAPREYELAYAGKSRSADVLADTMAVPLQPVKTFGPLDGEWSNSLIFGDNLQVLKTLLHAKLDGRLRNQDGSDGVRLCYIDPPFATMREFRSAHGQIAYSDRVAGAEFVESLRKRLILIHEILADDGTLYVHMDWKKGHYIKVVLDEIFGPQNFRNEIVWWYYNKYQGNINRFPSNHDVIYAYGKSGSPLFNVIHEEREAPTRQLKRVWDPVNKRLVNAKNDSGRVIYVDKDDRRVDDVWRIPMLQPADRTQRVDFPTQKPDTLIEVIVAASSGEGDIVLDAFLGSGTTAVVASRLGRRWIGIDSSKFAIYTAQKRLLRSPQPTPAFTVFNAGLYDYAALRELPWPAYRQFVIRLFECRDDAHELAGISFDGFLADHPVLVYDFTDHPEATIGASFVEDMGRICGERLGNKCFIIAPAVTVEPYEDYLDVGQTRFYFLRIPYSVIAELHRRAFSELTQPSSQELVNATISAVGFDFVSPPLVEFECRREGQVLFLQVTRFESGAFAVSSHEDGASALPMIMLDLDYDGAVFQLDRVYFADELRRADWAIELAVSELGAQAMVVYLDVFGNESRSLLSRSDFALPEQVI